MNFCIDDTESAHSSKSNKKLKISHDCLLYPPLIYDDDKNVSLEPRDIWRFNVSRSIMFKLSESVKMNFEKMSLFLGIDLDGTIINTKSCKRFPQHRDDWKLAFSSVAYILQEKVSEGFYVAIISNQSGLTNNQQIEDFQFKVGNILKEINVPIDFICSLKNDMYRKPNSGMIDFMCNIRGVNLDEVRLKSLFIGDAAGRIDEIHSGEKRDFNNTDYKLALNCGLHFSTPEVFFVKSKDVRNIDSTNWLSLNDNNFFLQNATVTSSRSVFTFQKPKLQEVILLVGPAATGKSLVAKKFEDHGYHRVNQDNLKTIEKCLEVAEDYLRNSQSICIDNTNITRSIRSRWINLAKAMNIKIKCVYMKTEKKIAMVLRELRLIDQTTKEEDKRKIETVVMNTHFKQLEIPSMSEGFDNIITLDFFPDRERLLDPRVKRLFNTYLV